MALHGERPLISLEHPLPGGAVLDQPAQVFENLPFNVNGVERERLCDLVGPGRRLPFGLPRTENANYL
jgi:hypothetical protein